MNTFTAVFFVVLAATVTLQIWLAQRHIEYVRARRDTVPPAFDGKIPLEAHRKAADYTAARTRVGQFEDLYGAVLLLAWTVGGGLYALDLYWRSVVSSELWLGTVFLLSVFVVMGILDLPLALYRTFVIEQRFGFNKMTWKLFVIDTLKGVFLGTIIGVPLLVLVLWLMEKAGTYWWVWVWALLTAFALVMQVVVPMFIMPWFNKFSPLEDAALAERVKRLLDRCGFRSKGLFIMDGSKRSAHGNAFFAGFGASKRIVFFDTLVARLTPAEVEAVLAHELGHYKLNHIKKTLLIGAATTLVELAILGFLVEQSWFYEGLGVQLHTLPIALLLFLLVSPTFDFFLSPLSSVRSRKHEFEADRYATEHAAAGELVGALVKLYKDNASTLTPDPLHSAFYDSHPPAAIRIARLKTA